MKNLHAHNESGPPCRHMEGMLQQTADRTAKPWVRWYAMAHAARCPRCATFLDRLQVTLQKLRETKDQQPNIEAMNRLEAQLRKAALHED